MVSYLSSPRVCKACGGEMVPVCDLELDSPRLPRAGEVRDCGLCCSGCGRRLPLVLQLPRSKRGRDLLARLGLRR
jgi:hypothetical protein